MLLLQLLFWLISCEFKISHLNALMQFKDPESDIYPNFTLSAEGSCVKWTSLNPNIARVEPIYDKTHCSTSARVEITETGPNRKSAIIVAEPKRGNILQCTVFVDEPKSIDILTTTKTIYIDSTYQTLKLQAFDSKKNIFTQLLDSKISWEVDHSHLRVIKIEDAKLLNLNPSLIIQGSKIGQAWVKASMGKQLIAKTNISVVQPISLQPNVITALPNTTFKLSLYTLKGVNNEQKELVPLLNSNFFLESTNPEVASVKADGTVLAQSIGITSIIAKDTTNPDNTAASLIKVCLPVRGEILDQYISLGEDPTFNPKLYDEDGLDFTIGQIYFEIEGEWNTTGRHIVTLSYMSFSMEAVVIVGSGLIVDPPVVVLPLNSDWFALNITGGFGDYSFNIKDNSLARILDGKIKTFEIEGETSIFISDNKRTNLTATVILIVSRIKKSVIELKNREIYVGNAFEPKCDFFAVRDLRFSIPINHEIISTNVAVTSANYIGVKAGFSKLYCSTDESRSPVISVSVIDQLEPKIYGRASPYSKIPLRYNGGPLTWENHSPPKIDIKCEGTKVNTNRTFFSILSPFSGLCNLTIQNIATEDNPNPIFATKSFKIDVETVDSLKIIPVDPLAVSIYKQCGAVPLSIPADDEVMSTYNAVSNHEHDLHVYALDKDQNKINYYSANNIELTALGQIISRFALNESTGDSTFRFLMPMSDVEISAKTHNSKEGKLELKVIKPIQIETPKTVFFERGFQPGFALEGGSGYVEVKGSDAVIENGYLISRPHGTGIYKYSVSDKCTDQEPVKTELHVVTVSKLTVSAPSVVALGSKTIITLSICDSNGVKIPTSLHSKAGVEILEPAMRKLGPDTWEFTPNEIARVRVIGTTKTDIKGFTDILIVPPITCSPSEIILMPGESIAISVSGPTDTALVSKNANVAVVRGNTITAVLPGNTTVAAECSSAPSVEPFLIKVRVLKPISLLVRTSTKSVVEGGDLQISLTVKTDGGYRWARSSQWGTGQLSYLSLNTSHIFVRCSVPGENTVMARAYNLETAFRFHVEERLVLETGSLVSLPPGGSIQIRSRNNLMFSLMSTDDSIAVAVGTVVEAVAEKGTAVFIAKAGTQTVPFTVQISHPSALVLNQTAQFVIHCLLSDQYGRQYSSYRGVTFSHSGVGYNATEIDANGYMSFANSANEQAHIIVRATSLGGKMSISGERKLIVQTAISPENPIILSGTSVHFTCPHPQPSWQITNKKVGVFSRAGLLSTLQSGNTTISCGPKADTLVRIVDLISAHISDAGVDQFHVVPIYNARVVDSAVTKPTDFTFSCEWDSDRCGKVRPVSNSSGHFCVIDRFARRSCPAFSKLEARFHSKTLQINVKATKKVPYLSTVDFGVSNGAKYELDVRKRKVVLPVSIDRSILKIEAPGDLAVSQPEEGGIVVRAMDRFKGPGQIKLTHTPTGETIAVDIIVGGSSSINERKEPIIYKHPSTGLKDIALFISVPLSMALLAILCMKWPKN